MTARCDVAVIGGGIAGLAAAWRAHELGLSVAVFESARAVGGKIRSEVKDGYLIEHGPNSFLGLALPLWHLIAAVGLEDQVIAAQKPADRFIVRDRRARKLPTDPMTLLAGDYLSPLGKLRMMAEPLVPGGARDDDTAWQFAARRFGQEAARYLVSPFVNGVYAGDIHRLGAKDAFSKLWALEKAAGSLVIGMTTRPPPVPAGSVADVVARQGMFSFAGGLGALPKAIAAALPAGSVRLQTPVAALRRTPEGWQIDPHPHLAAHKEPVLAQKVVVALPAHHAAELLPVEAARAAAALEKVESVRVAVVHVGGPDPSGEAPRGFGVLIPPGEGLRTLGILFPSSVFAGRAPQGHYLHTGFLGGSHDPDAADLPDDALVSLVLRARSCAFAQCDHLPAPTFSHVVRWREAIPQYTVGHRRAVAEAAAEVAYKMPGVAMAGSWLAGISMADSAASGMDAVDQLLAGRWP